MTFPGLQELMRVALQHIELVAAAAGLCIPVGILLGVGLTRGPLRRYAPYVINTVNIGQTIPSLAVVALAMPLIAAAGLPRYSIGLWPSLLALFLYGLLPIVRNTYAGLNTVDISMVEAARGMGMTNVQILIRVELPLALRVIMAGIRTSIVVNIGTACLAFLIGGGGLGVFIFTGIAMDDVAYMLSGAVLAAILAVVADYLLHILERALTPRGIRS